ncbi:MAG: glycosyltransferase family 2 protein [Cyclobacteriaceae bacterium]
MRIIVPMAGSVFLDSSEYTFPKPLIDVHGKPLIEYVLASLSKISEPVQFTFLVKDQLCTKYNLDYSLALLTKTPDIIRVKGDTKGATCSVLLAIDKIAKDEEVVIVNSDQVFLAKLNQAIAFFRDHSSVGGLITFDSVHPRWSFALADEDNIVLQTAEKKPISRNAIAGFYYFRSFGDFIESAMSSVLSEEFFEDQLYVSSVMNQIILNNRKVMHFPIRNEEYISFYSPLKIKEFERLLADNKIEL